MNVFDFFKNQDALELELKFNHIVGDFMHNSGDKVILENLDNNIDGLVFVAVLVYISFDTVPAPKGAAIHIEAFVRSLAEAFGKIQLVTVSPASKGTDAQELWPGVIQTTLPAIGDTLINRVMYFRTMLGIWWQKKRFDVVHIRSIYEGFPIAVNKEKLCDKLIFEVNGLPSIELKYRYPKVAEDRELLQKLTAQEQICLDASDLILTPSCVTRDFLQKRGVPATKIRVIPNGVDLNVFSPSPPLSLPSLSLPSPILRHSLGLARR